MPVSKKPIVLITMGDYNGIGPEVALKAVTSPYIRNLCKPILVGSLDVFEFYAGLARMKIRFREVDDVQEFQKPSDGTISVVHLRRFEQPRITPGKLSAEAGNWAGQAIVVCGRLSLKKNAEAIVTAPASKEALNLGGYLYPGQTEMFGALCRSRSYAMMLIAGKFRVGLATIHVPLRRVAQIINKQIIVEKLRVMYTSLRCDFHLHSPRIAVLGLNPHAGENGMIGSEEHHSIVPSLQTLRRKNMRIDGPFPADGFFGTHAYRSYDAVLAMYHDQGLIPLKMVGFKKGVNFTAGLPIVRTSPDHGTAYDIAGKKNADPSSMIEAIKLAVVIANNRKKGHA